MQQRNSTMFQVAGSLNCLLEQVNSRVRPPVTVVPDVVQHVSQFVEEVALAVLLESIDVVVAILLRVTLFTTTAISRPLSSRTSIAAEPGMRPSCCQPLKPITLSDHPRPERRANCRCKTRAETEA